MAENSDTSNDRADPRRELASVSALLEDPRVKGMIEHHSRPLVLDAIRDALDSYRQDLKPGDAAPAFDQVVDTVREFLSRSQFQRLRAVVNATGVILSTNLGRAVLPQTTVEALATLDGCCNLQIDLETGLRGKRNSMTEDLLCRLTGAEAAMVVNNNAAATLLMLAALCKGKEVIVSRGQLIEIGGSYRLPDCIHQSGAIMVEVGTTNKTHLHDYENALTENTGALLHVNPSNYRIIGFSESVPIADLAALRARQSAAHEDLLVIDDLGCGALVDLTQYGLPHEPTAPESIEAGADLVCFSGDKLIGGPQAGIIVGRKDIIARIRKHPLTRMMRICKLTDMALEHTLRLFLEPETLTEKHPTFRMLTMPPGELKRKAQRIKRRVAKERDDIEMRVIKGESAMGGGSLPGVPIPTYLLAVSVPAISAERVGFLLRHHEPPVITRIKDNTVLLDMRTLMAGEDKVIVDALKRI